MGLVRDAGGKTTGVVVSFCLVAMLTMMVLKRSNLRLLWEEKKTSVEIPKVCAKFWQLVLVHGLVHKN